MSESRTLFLKIVTRELIENPKVSLLGLLSEAYRLHPLKGHPYCGFLWFLLKCHSIESERTHNDRAPLLPPLSLESLSAHAHTHTHPSAGLKYANLCSNIPLPGAFIPLVPRCAMCDVIKVM